MTNCYLHFYGNEEFLDEREQATTIRVWVGGGKKTGDDMEEKQSKVKEERLTLSMRKLKDINKKINKILIILL